MLYHHYFFEFAGMPQAGKTEIAGIVAHYLRRKGYPVDVRNGGSENSPLHDASIADLNLSLACQTVDFVVNSDRGEKSEHKIYLLDRGLIDRNIFTSALLLSNKIDESQAKATSAILTLPRSLECLDGVYLGEVMQPQFLSTLRLATEDGYNKARFFLQNIHLIDTEQYNTRISATAWLIVHDILRVIEEKENVKNNSSLLEGEIKCVHFSASGV